MLLLLLSVGGLDCQKENKSSSSSLEDVEYYIKRKRSSRFPPFQPLVDREEAAEACSEPNPHSFPIQDSLNDDISNVGLFTRPVLKGMDRRWKIISQQLFFFDKCKIKAVFFCSGIYKVAVIKPFPSFPINRSYSTNPGWYPDVLFDFVCASRWTILDRVWNHAEGAKTRHTSLSDGLELHYHYWGGARNISFLAGSR